MSRPERVDALLLRIRQETIDAFDECAEILNKCADLKRDNAKLRTQLTDVTESMGRVEERCAKLWELVQDFDKCLDTALCLARGAGYPAMPDQKLFDSLRPRMRELGSEVDDGETDHV